MSPGHTKIYVSRKRGFSTSGKMCSHFVLFYNNRVVLRKCPGMRGAFAESRAGKTFSGKALI